MGAAVRVDNVSVIKDGKYLLRDISTAVKAGSCAAVIGPNGAGKSTLVSLLCGYTSPSAGSLEILGKTFGKTDIRKLRPRIGLVETSRVPEFHPNLTLAETVVTGIFGSLMLPINEPVTEVHWEKAAAELENFELTELADARFDSLSTGEKAKALLARAMAAAPELLILDEPTAGLDLAARAKTVKMLEKIHARQNPPTMIIVTHHLAELPGCVDYAILLKRGKILEQGEHSEILTDENLSKTYDCPVKIIKHNNHYTTQVLH